MRKKVACNCKEESNGTRESHKIIPDGWVECSYRNLFKVASGEGLTQKKMIYGVIPVFGGNGVSGYHNSSNNDDTNIIIGRVGANCGSVILYSGKCWITDNALYIKEKYGEYNDLFMFYKLTHEQLNRLADRNAQPLISGEKIYGLKAVIPKKIEEQGSIANILSTWDKAIELKEKLIEEKKKQKSGLMQKLLTGKVRLPWFDGEWEFAELSTVCDKVTRCIDKPNEPYYRLGLRSHAKGTFHEYVENPDDNSMDKLYIVKENDLIVNITFAWEHAIALAGSNDDGKLVSHRFPTYLFKDNADPRFYKHYVMQSKFKKMLDDISPGGAGRNRVMNQKSFLKLMVHIPSLEEQKAIANVLDLLNKEISLHQSELDSLKQQKKGLMQLLLTGIVRVTVETN